MKERTKLGLRVLEAALLMGLLGDALLRATPWGINVLLWVGALAAAILALLARWRRDVLNAQGRWLFLPVILFAAVFAWRDSWTLRFMDGLAVLVSLSLIALGSRMGRIDLAGLVEYVVGGIVAGLDAAFGPFMLLLNDIEWRTIPRSGWSRHTAAVVRGLIIALPLLLIFGGLFMAADAVFEGIVNHAFNLNFETLFSHTFLAVFFAWIAGGFLRGLMLGSKLEFTGNGRPVFLPVVPTETAASEDADSLDAPVPSKPLRLGIVETSVVLGLLDILFLAFVTIQIRYFFGGAAFAQASTGLTYAEYARRGFFELVTVATLVLPLLLVAHWLLRKENPVHERVFRVLAGAQVALLFVIMASAVGRMRLYQSEYGLTELRLYTTAFMGWLALLFIWFGLTVLRGQRERFACGALVAAFLVLITLHAVNPDALIVRVNVDHAQMGRAFDADYAASLSADAVPALLAALPDLGRYNRCMIANDLLDRLSSLESGDWRTWNRSRSVARDRLIENSSALFGLNCQRLGAGMTDPGGAGGRGPAQERY
ncbi:MAG TPA: DUF4173 domain-containing protein [Pyrinomonadaceae bacterium]|jgi:hypothetical protein